MNGNWTSVSYIYKPGPTGPELRKINMSASEFRELVGIKINENWKYAHCTDMMFYQATNTDKPAIHYDAGKWKVEERNLVWRWIQFYKLGFKKFNWHQYHGSTWVHSWMLCPVPRCNVPQVIPRVCLQVSFPVFSVSISHHVPFSPDSLGSFLFPRTSYVVISLLFLHTKKKNFLPFSDHQNFIHPLKPYPNTNYHYLWRLPYFFK